MSFNRNKSLTKVQKLLQKGKNSEAIEELKLVVDDDPTDVRNTLRLGDLYAKVGNIESACETYHKVGEYYAKDGFFLKAVAVFKQILKLDPGLIRVYLRLAELYQQLGLNSEAMKQYQVVVKHYENQGLKKESLDVLRKMAELDPENTASRVKLAELYAREGHKEASIEQFKTISSDLTKKNNFQDLASVYEKMETLGLGDERIRLDLSEIYLRLAEPKRALAKLQEVFKSDPKNPTVLELLARTFLDLQQPDKAKSVYSELVQVLDTKGMTLEKERITAKLRALGGVAPAAAKKAESEPPALVIEDDPVAATLSNPVPKAAAPKPTPSAPEASAASASGSQNKMIQEAEVFLKYGLVDKACQMLAHAVVSEPDNATYRGKLIEAYKGKNDTDGLIGVLTRAANAADKAGKGSVAKSLRQEIDQLSPSMSAEPIESSQAAPQDETIALEAEMVVESEESSAPSLEGIDLEIVDDIPSEAPVLEAVSIEPEAQEIVLEEAPVQSVPELDFDFGKEFERMDEVASELSLDLSEPPSESVPEPVLEAIPPVEVVAPEEVVPPVEVIPQKEVELVQEVAPEVELSLDADFSFDDEVEKAVESPVMEREPEKIEELDFNSASFALPKDVPVIEKAAPIIEKPATVVEKAVPVVQKVEPVIEMVAEKTVFEPVQKTAPKPTADAFVTEMEEAEFFVSQGLLEEAKGVYENILEQNPEFGPALEKIAELKGAQPQQQIRNDGEGPERRQTPRVQKAVLSREVEIEPPVQEKKSLESTRAAKASGAEEFFDLTSELQDEIHDLESELHQKPKDEDEDYLSPEEVITEFKKGVSRTVAKDDHQTHYNLGIAYKEMGLLNEAIHEFEVAAENGKMAVDCASMIGLCLIGKKDYAAAIDVYRKAIGRVSPQSEEAMGLSYELAEAYIGNGNLTEAYKLFARIRDVDANFRDVRRRAKELEADLGSNAPHPSAPEKKDEKDESLVKISNKKNKISYI